MDTKTLTPKAQQTRQRIFETAIELFTEKGYDETTMRDIAAAADCSLGLTYRYFSRKDDLIMALYWQTGEETISVIDRALPDDMAIADRFHTIVTHKLEQLTPFRDALGALFGAMMNPNSDVSVLGTQSAGIRGEMINGFQQLVADAKDAPKSPKAEQLGTLLHSGHLLMILFWLFDRTPNQRATHQLLDLSREGLKMLRPMLILPLFSKMLLKLSDLISQVFGVEFDATRDTSTKDDSGG